MSHDAVQLARHDAGANPHDIQPVPQDSSASHEPDKRFLVGLVGLHIGPPTVDQLTGLGSAQLKSVVVSEEHEGGRIDPIAERADLAPVAQVRGGVAAQSDKCCRPPQVLLDGARAGSSTHKQAFAPPAVLGP
jgi:hypothetical protein